MYNELIDQIAEHLDKGEEFAVAQVISREAPSSGKPGDKAIILKDGTLIGWIGGGCVRGIAVKEALEAIKDNKSRLIRIDPDAEDGNSGSYKTYRMTCHSGGTMELFIEPVIPNPHIIIVGKSNIARALAKLSLASNFRVTVMTNDARNGMFPGVKDLHESVDFDNTKIDNNTFIVVATQGESDEESVKHALETICHYVGFIASKRKSDKIAEYLHSVGIDDKRINQLRTPVGMDINAKLPEEIAISILAEIIHEFREETGDLSSASIPLMEEEEPQDLYINPVCNVPVSKSGAKYVVEHGGHTVYFCCDGCKASFDKEPDKYIEVLEART